MSQKGIVNPKSETPLCHIPWPFPDILAVQLKKTDERKALGDKLLTSKVSYRVILARISS